MVGPSEVHDAWEVYDNAIFDTTAAPESLRHDQGPLRLEAVIGPRGRASPTQDGLAGTALLGALRRRLCARAHRNVRFNHREPLELPG